MGGGDCCGKGDRAIVRQNMAGQNSVGHHMFLLHRTGDDGMRLLNEAGLWVPLMEGYGFDPLRGDISTRRPVTELVDTIDRMLKEAMRAHPKQAGSASSSSSDDSEDEERLTIDEEVEVSCPNEDGSVARPRPIYDPLCGRSRWRWGGPRLFLFFAFSPLAVGLAAIVPVLCVHVLCVPLLCAGNHP